MKAIQLIKTGQPLQEKDVPLRKPGPNDVLVRIQASGICHSDAHYRAGISQVAFTPLTLGHEISGIVEQAGDQVKDFTPGDRVCIHYMLTCGECIYCTKGNEQFCIHGKMIGKHYNGGYAEMITIPARNLLNLPEEVTFEYGATIMCSTATSFHALRKGNLNIGDSVAVFGAGGLGMSAIQLAFIMGAIEVYAVDINKEKLATAENYGAIPINAFKYDPVKKIKELTNGRGVDISLELTGLTLVMQQAVQSLANLGRAVMVGISHNNLNLNVYTEILGKESVVIGSSDHLKSELNLLLELVRLGKLDFSHIVTNTVRLNAGDINNVLDALEEFRSNVRTVILP